MRFARSEKGISKMKDILSKYNKYHYMGGGALAGLAGGYLLSKYRQHQLNNKITSSQHTMNILGSTAAQRHAYHLSEESLYKLRHDPRIKYRNINHSLNDLTRAIGKKEIYLNNDPLSMGRLVADIYGPNHMPIYKKPMINLPNVPVDDFLNKVVQSPLTKGKFKIPGADAKTTKDIFNKYVPDILHHEYLESKTPYTTGVLPFFSHRGPNVLVGEFKNLHKDLRPQRPMRKVTGEFDLMDRAFKAVGKTKNGYRGLKNSDYKKVNKALTAGYSADKDKILNQIDKDLLYNNKISHKTADNLLKKQEIMNKANVGQILPVSKADVFDKSDVWNSKKIANLFGEKEFKTLAKPALKAAVPLAAVGYGVKKYKDIKRKNILNRDKSGN